MSNYGDSVLKALKTALGAIDYLPNAVAAWVAAHGGNKALADENAKKLRQAQNLLQQVLASLPNSREFIVFGVHGVSGTFTSENDFVDALAKQGFKRTGSETGRHLCAELIGAPKFSNLIGPIYGGPGVCRYETGEVYERNSR